jgi:predicted Ser/Thr protein kinase
LETLERITVDGDSAGHRTDFDRLKVIVRTAQDLFGITACPADSLIEPAVDSVATEIWQGKSAEGTRPESDSKYLKSIGDYEIQGEIARGGMGVIYRAMHRKLRRQVAIKMILPARQQNPDALERFLREARAAARLQHPGIVPIYEVGEAQGRPFLVMAYVDGHSLREHAQEIPMSAKDAATVVLAITEALNHAHEHDIVHRDIKPHNILLDSQNRPQITDFGLAKLLDDEEELTLAGQMLGTPGYMAPEQVAGHSHEKAVIDARTDVYALGATLYFVLTSRPPFQTASIAATLHQIANHDPVAPRRLNPHVPRDLETICLKCLRKEPNRRYATAASLADDLRRWLNHEPIQARRTGMVERGWLWTRRSPGFAFLAVVLLMVVIAGALTFYESRFRLRASALVEQLLTANLDNVPALIQDLQPYRSRTDLLLEDAAKEAAAKSQRNGC